MAKYQEVLTQEEIQELINGCNGRKSRDLKLIIKTFVNTGMRDSELINFKVNWILDSENKDYPGLIRIQSNDYPIKFTPKYVSEREIPINSALLEELKRFTGTRKGGYVFRSQKKSNQYRFNRNSIINKINFLSKNILNRTIGTHIFRRTFASYIYSEIRDITVVQKLMGHASPAITWRYIQKIPTRERYNEIINLNIFIYK